jgi:hypothetical protein
VRGHADVGTTAAPAADHSGEQEVRAVITPTRDVDATLGEDRLGLLEGLVLD